MFAPFSHTEKEKRRERERERERLNVVACPSFKEEEGR